MYATLGRGLPGGAGDTGPGTGGAVYGGPGGGNGGAAGAGSQWCRLSWCELDVWASRTPQITIAGPYSFGGATTGLKGGAGGAGGGGAARTSAAAVVAARSSRFSRVRDEQGHDHRRWRRRFHAATGDCAGGGAGSAAIYAFDVARELRGTAPSARTPPPHPGCPANKRARARGRRCTCAPGHPGSGRDARC